ncbi:carboxymuconolactone decarboxylase family protein [Candidatus Entotheonella serta]|nr:carboxymuconolactone decarboxylase family protein [Candidatus Entotheonella serta]
MARVRDVEIEAVPKDIQPIYRRYAEEYGPFLNQVKVFAHRPPALKHIMGLLLDLADEALLPKRYLEIAVVVVSKLNECTYCVAHHAPRLAEQGLPPATIARILEPDCPDLDEIDRLVRDYAVQVTQTPQRIDNAFYARLRKHFNEEQIVELTLRTALCGFFNRFNDALQIGIEDGVLETLLASGNALESLPTHGASHPVPGD